MPAGTLTVAGQGVGEHCQVTGRMFSRISPVDGQTYAIGFEMRLPQSLQTPNPAPKRLRRPRLTRLRKRLKNLLQPNQQSKPLKPKHPPRRQWRQ